VWRGGKFNLADDDQQLVGLDRAEAGGELDDAGICVTRHDRGASL
jgi:hypothetical protein